MDRKDAVKVIQICLVGSLVVLGILLVFTINQLNEFKKFMPISNLYFNENEVIRVNHANIFVSEGGIVAPQQKLQLMMDLTNKGNYTLSLEPEIYVSIGGVPKNQIVNIVHSEINPISTKTIEPIDFYLADAGPNTINVKLNFYINNTLWETEEASTTIYVLSSSEKMQMQQYNNTSIFYAGSLIFTGIALGFTTYQTMKSREERTQTFRAWIGQGDGTIELFRVYNENNDMKLAKEWKEMTDLQQSDFKRTKREFGLLLKNYGQLPAYNVVTRYAVSRSENFDELNKNQFSDEKSELMPGSSTTHELIISEKFYESDISSFFVFFECKYLSAGSKDERIYGFKSRRVKGSLRKLLSWTEEDRPKEILETNELEGTDGKDELEGTDGKDELEGTDGKDELEGTDGKDE